MTIVSQVRPMTAKAGPMEPLVPYVAMDDNLSIPRRIAATVVAADGTKPRLMSDVGSFTGELLEAFLDQFQDARGQWIDATDNSKHIAEKRLERFGDRVDYIIGCPGRTVSDGSIVSGVDVLMSSWISSHRDADAIATFYQGAGQLVGPGGWLVVLDHVGFNNEWEKRILTARSEFQVLFEGPPAHHDRHIATREQHLIEFKAAGFMNVEVVWESLGTVLFVARR